MTHFEHMETQGQTSIFDFMDSVPVNKTHFANGDKVRIQFYDNELGFIKAHCPQLFEIGEVVGKKLDFYVVLFVDSVLYVEGKKLHLA